MSVATVASIHDMLCCQEAFGGLLGAFFGSNTAAVACADPICGNDGTQILRERRGRSRTLKCSVNSKDGASATSCSSSGSPSRPSTPFQEGRSAKRSIDASKVDKIQPMSNNKPQTKNQGNFKIVGLGTSTAKPSTGKKNIRSTKSKSRGSRDKARRDGRSSSPLSTRSRCNSSGKGKRKNARPERDLPPTTNLNHLMEVDINRRRGRTPSREAPGGRRRSRSRAMPTRHFSQRGNDIESTPSNTGKVKKESSCRRWGFGSRRSLRVDQNN
jgi:hypothetical protein